MEGRTRVGERAREETRAARAGKLRDFIDTQVEPAILRAAKDGFGHCTLYMGTQDAWLVGPRGETNLLEEIATSLDVTLSSFSKECVAGEKVFVVVLSWEEDSLYLQNSQESSSSAQKPQAPSTQSSQHSSTKKKNTESSSSSSSSANQSEVRDVPPPPPRKAQVVTRPFVGHYVHYGPTLHSCCKNGDLETLRRMLEIDPNIEINAPDSFGYTPLHHAVSNGFLEHAMTLIQYGAAPAAEGMKKLTPLHCASYGGKTELVRFLAPLVDVNHLDSSGRSPLHWAAERGFQAIVEEICNQPETLVDIVDNYGMTPRKYAIFWGYSEIASILEAHSSENTL